MSDVNFNLLFRPKDIIPDIVFHPSGTEMSAEDKKKIEGVTTHGGLVPLKELCRSCGWTTYNELTSSYLSRLRVYRTRLNSALWMMGNDYMLWDRAGEKDMNNDYMTYQFLKAKGTKNIPLLEEMHQYGKPSDPHQFVVMSRAKGLPLINVWPTASEEEKRGYADQVIAAIRELRQHTAPYPQRVDGGPLYDHIIGTCVARKACKTIGKTTEDWFNNMDTEIRYGLTRQYGTKDNAVIEEKLKELKDNFPEGAPYVLTHGDINSRNIIVNNGKIQAIIDWELAGYSPLWLERWAQSERCQSDGCVELYQMVWSELDAESARGQFQAQVCDPVRKAEVSWGHCPITHSERDDEWRRPAWCECQPVGGLIRKGHLDAELKHEIDYSETAWATYNPDT